MTFLLLQQLACLLDFFGEELLIGKRGEVFTHESLIRQALCRIPYQGIAFAGAEKSPLEDFHQAGSSVYVRA